VASAGSARSSTIKVTFRWRPYNIDLDTDDSAGRTMLFFARAELCDIQVDDAEARSRLRSASHFRSASTDLTCTERVHPAFREAGSTARSRDRAAISATTGQLRPFEGNARSFCRDSTISGAISNPRTLRMRRSRTWPRGCSGCGDPNGPAGPKRSDASTNIIL
jgi:hypothetical protein